MQMPLPVSKPKLIMLNNYSEGWQQRYLKENYLAVDPTVAHGMRSVMPLVWSEKGVCHQSPLLGGCSGARHLRWVGAIMLRLKGCWWFIDSGSLER
ncbi:autoinducer binding domain-containing protein [Undibacterium arcticum]